MAEDDAHPQAHAALNLLLLLGLALAQEPCDLRFRGKVEGVRGPVVRLLYDFSDPRQLEDFEQVVPPHLGEGKGKVAIEKGKLLLDGSAALRFRTRGVRRLQLSARIVRKGDLGLFAEGPEPGRPYLLINLFDRGLRRDGAMLIARCESAGPKLPVLWRELATADGAEVEKRIRGDAPFELEICLRPETFLLRLGTLYRARPTPEPPDPRDIGLWVREAAMDVDEILLDLEPAEGVALSPDPATAHAPDANLQRALLAAPLSADAAAARRELGRRGPEGWKRLDSAIRTLAKKTPYAAVPLIAELGGGPEPGRHEYLAKLLRKQEAPELRIAILRALAPDYPANAGLLHAGLLEPLPDRVALLRALVPLGLAEAILQRCCEDPLLGAEAYEVLRDRGAGLEAAALGQLPKTRAKEGLSSAASRAFLREFAQAQNWKLIEAFVGLLDDADPEVARGAYLLLLTISGKDIAPVKDFWRSWIAAKRGEYATPDFGEPGIVAAAILRGRAFLKGDLAEDGKCVWPQNSEWPGCVVGATALGVYALRVAGLPADDAVLKQAVQETLLDRGVAMRGDLEGYTYALSLLAMALESMDPAAYKPHLQTIARRLVDGQLDNGQWTYYCKDRDYERRPGAGDNSNTQYAMLGLRSARRAGVEIPRQVWERNERFWRENQNGNGGWGYGPKGSFDHELSMTSAGVATLGICAEALHGLKAWDIVRESRNVGSGMLRLGELLLERGYDGQEIYTFYGVERASILTGTRAFDDFDWYREGASVLVNAQKESGAWGNKHAHGIAEGAGYGEAIDTAYALLFLKRATTGLPGADGGGVVKVPGAERLKKKRAK